MKLPSVKELSVAQKTVLLRTNYDVPLKSQKSKIKNQNLEVADGTRIDESLPTINYLLEQQAKIIILSHLGRPEGKVNPDLSLKPIADCLGQLLKRELPLFSKIEEVDKNQQVVILENLRFWPGEEDNDLAFAQNLAALGDFFVNDAFACAHRQHASIVGIPKFLPAAFGFDFIRETEVLDKVRNNPRRPVTVILGGVKEDKLEVVDKLLNWADYLLIGGKLSTLISNSEKIFIADLNPEGKDITLESTERFKKIITQAGTIIWAGPMGVFEDSHYEVGTKAVAEAVVESGAYTVVGGGDTEAALTKFGLTDKVDYLVKQQTMFISSGGGAMFEFLAQGTLPGIEAIVK